MLFIVVCVVLSSVVCAFSIVCFLSLCVVYVIYCESVFHVAYVLCYEWLCATTMYLMCYQLLPPEL